MKKNSPAAKAFRKVKKDSLSTLKKKVWALFSKFIRLKYAKNGMVECYTCGIVKHWKQMQAGHGFGGRSNSILFESKIVRPQCYGCNIMMKGNYDIFHAKLETEYGFGILQEFVKIKQQTRHFTAQELKDLAAEYKERCEQLINDDE